MTSTGKAPVGYRFHPKDEELVDHYLKLKMLGYDHYVDKIAEVNVCDYEPWKLPVLSVIKSNDPEWYFFCPRKYKYSNSQRANRTTKVGYWKVTGKDRKIMSEDTGEQIGTKKTLVFYKGRMPNGVRTSWKMHEYNPTFNFPNQRDFVLFKLKTDPDDMSTFEEGEFNSMVNSNFENPSTNENSATFEESEYGYGLASDFEDSHQLQAYLQSFDGCDEKDYNLNSALQLCTEESFSHWLL